MPNHILLTIDVEDWFQVENLRQACPVSSWPSHELRVERNTHRLLDLLDSIEMKNRGQENIRQDQQDRQEVSSAFPDEKQKGNISYQDKTFSQFRLETEKKSCKSCLASPSPRIRATFFVLGWIAERVPHLVREIHARGHEVASHGYSHELCNQCSPGDLKEDFMKSKKLLEDIIGERVHGYRAPSFSVSDDILKMIEEAGYEYDSSYNSFAVHGRYGKISLNGGGREGIAYRISNAFCELPISNLPLSSFPILGTLGHFRHFRHFFLPWGGGAYFRLLPSRAFRWGVKGILRRQQGYLFYIHPWELDPEQPKAENIPFTSRFKHYTNLKKTDVKLTAFMREFRDCRFTTCCGYLSARGVAREKERRES